MSNPSNQLPLALRLRDASSFESLVEGPNGAAVASVKAAVSESAQVYIWGGQGAGRSHILEATVRLAESKGLMAALLPASELRSSPVEVLEGLADFNLLALDDIDKLAGNSHWEEGLFHLYNQLKANAGSFICSASAPPSEAGFLLPDLASRLAAGPVFALQSLEDRQLIDLLIARADIRGLELTEEVARFLVTRCSRQAGDLMVLLDQLDQAALQAQRRLTVPFVKSVLTI